VDTVTAQVTDSGVEQAEITIREAAALAGVSQKTIRKLLKAGKVRGRMGGEPPWPHLVHRPRHPTPQVRDSGSGKGGVERGWDG